MFFIKKYPGVSLLMTQGICACGGAAKHPASNSSEEQVQLHFETRMVQPESTLGFI